MRPIRRPSHTLWRISPYGPPELAGTSPDVEVRLRETIVKLKKTIANKSK
ncbi:hypothetical protein [Nonomuraea sp. NPDC049480]